ncbi:HPr(Ser) kinase/phosphatase [Clostridium tertium]|uniref:HPr kinase/phosphorylase n=1 Tax=Clostridium tertium TaxID=1559 RepID=A0A9X3XNH0_9CLOT|nr:MULTISPECIES: HPr(Ser) kinase/phosphatase [Clostridium]EEH97340.2 HPr kinase/phosphorylase [Clostridium sp. 7_2_43FAA]MBS5306163.1 HPr kinase/phosphorylase [Clostridium sp.]MDB1940372.1 HPr(Ser) kinase/phosphatase [Clostridium tertium]MDB1945980.1 HPr(Ser) kinase/phosphatase [Clostridium tertium]MDB1951183.1 HPr(Ser) kinase/phosphatase [Clostridium tertium]
MSVTVEKIIKDFDMEVLVEGENDIEIFVNDINRPGLQLSGFYNYFAPERIQVIGKAEWSFLEAMALELRKKRIDKYFSFNLKCLVITRDLEPQEELLKAAKKNKIWLMRTRLVTTKFISKLTIYLTGQLAPETRLHGVLVDVYGIGILITGESGIGKSETALELIKRGHRLVTDDAVDIKEIDGELIGRSPRITIGMLEVRGIGIIDVASLYGLSSILPEKDIQLLMHFEHWKDDGDYDRLGLNDDRQDILGVKVKKLRVPVRPGRNIAVIIEAAAVNYRHSLMSDVTPVDIIESRMDKIIE